MTTAPRANFNYPCHYRLGAGRAAELADLCKERGITRPLVVTDPGVRALPWFPPIIDSLMAAGLHVMIFSDVRPNPLGTDVEAGLVAYRDHDANGVVLIGGGSALDAGKCVALLAHNPGSVFDYEDVGDNYKRADASKIPPMIALPTTAGTGSEVGRASLVINERQEKKVIFHPKMQPADVISDPELTVGLPPHLTAFTGLDAYVHCFEAFCVPAYHPMADGIALEGMRLVAEYLPRAVEDGTDLEARTNMLLASSMGATAFQKGLGAVHAISHALGGKLDVHHGLANAIVLPYVMMLNRKDIEGRCAIVARHIGVDVASFDGLMEWTLRMRQSLGVPHTLADVDQMDETMAEHLAPLAFVDPSLGGNPTPTRPEDLAATMKHALSGKLV